MNVRFPRLRDTWAAFKFSFLVALVTFFLRGATAAEVLLEGRTFKLPEGFTIEKVAGPPLVDRPITADFDEQGRLYVADSSGSSDNGPKQLQTKTHRIVRLAAANSGGFFPDRTVFADRMMFPEGTMWLSGSLYVAAPPSIWKLADTTGNGVADQRSEWFEGKTLTNCANDLHGPYQGPDGWIYWCKGAFAEQTYERPGHKPLVTKAAHIFRSRPDGSGIEPVMVGGMDNPIDVVFTPGGERLFTTTFLQNPAGGRRDGILHAVYGGIYGKVHDVTDDFPHTSPDLMPVLVHLGPAACCGLARYESDAFGPEFKDNLFAACFNLHKVTRHILSPAGATFASKDEDFVVCDSVDFHPTDVVEDADGSVLILDTGGWYKICCPTSQFGKPDVLGAIYRVRKAGIEPREDPRGLKVQWAALDADGLAGLLGDARPAVRKRAIAELAAKGPAAVAVIKKLLDHSTLRSRLSAVWSITRIDSADARKTARLALADPDSIVRQAAAHSASVWRDRGAVPKLIELLGNASAQNRRVAAEALGRIGDASAVPALFKQLAAAHDQVLDHSLTYALIDINDARATAVALASSNPRVRRAAMIAIDQMDGGKLDPQVVTADLNAGDAPLRETAGWIAAHHSEWGEVLAAAMKARITATTLTESDRAQLHEQLMRLAKSPVIQKLLADIVADSSVAPEARRMALAAMGDAAITPAPSEWVSAIDSVLAGKNSQLVADAVAALRKLAVDRSRSQPLQSSLASVANRSDLAPLVRLDALAAMSSNPSISPELFTFLQDQLSSTQPASVRLSATHVISRSKFTNDQLEALTDLIKNAGPLEIDRVLAAFAQSGDAEVGAKLVAALREARSLTSLRADIVQARLAKFPAAVRDAAQPLLARINPDAGQQKAKLEQLLASMPAGEIRRGQQIFNSPKISCSTCHAIGYVGGNVGPDLTKVGSIRTERDLLESILYPSASFVQSFEPMLVDTRDGDRQSGILRKNDKDEVVLVTGPNQELHIPQSNVKEIRPGTVSVMPAGLEQQLSRQELADLVAFLKACK